MVYLKNTFNYIFGNNCSNALWSIFADVVSIDDGCYQTLDPGPCREYVVKWYYDAIANSCAQFWFGGCLGNENRFDSERSCRETCVKF
uniref:BPTI/Kunitz inhibitor domain-containing protein n=1 Tax=Oryzias latipes TaxID=8090 RepID=A0A3B3HGC1_ORYLA